MLERLQLNDRLIDYVLAVSSRESEVLSRLRQETAQMPMAEMQIPTEQGQFLALLVKLLNARRVLEIGVFTGYSTLWMASAMPRDGTLVACDVSEEWTSVARRYWNEAGVDDRIDLRLAPAVKTLEELLEAGGAGTFDLAFIDADKQTYSEYFEKCLALLRCGGLVVLDNVLRSGEVLDPSITEEGTVAIRELNSRLHHDDRVALSLLPMADGITLALKQ